MNQKQTESLARAEAELARAILRVTVTPNWIGDPDDVEHGELEAGRLPPGIASAAVKYASARANSFRASDPRATPVNDAWERSVASYVKQAGKLPTTRQLAKHSGKSIKASWYAIQRLKTLGKWPIIPNRDLETTIVVVDNEISR